MKKSTQILRAIIDGKIKITEKLKFSMIDVSLICIHLSLLLLFIYMGIWPMALFNSFSVIMYIFMNIGIRRMRYKTCFFMTYIEIFLHTILAVFFIGADFGFELYNVVLVPVSFYLAFTIPKFKGRLLTPIMLTFTCLAVSVGSRVYYYICGPVFNVKNEILQSMVYTVNCSISYVMLLIFSVFFIIEIRTKQSELIKTASFDVLTGLYNRRLIGYKYKEFVDRAGKNDKFSFILGDIDDFKNINDSYGHSYGDYILEIISGIIKDSINNDEIACRWGGEEVLILFNGNSKSAYLKADEIRRKINDYNFNKLGKNNVTMTFGVSEYRYGITIEKMVKEADDNLYIGKRNGKNCVIY